MTPPPPGPYWGPTGLNGLFKREGHMALGYPTALSRPVGGRVKMQFYVMIGRR